MVKSYCAGVAAVTVVLLASLAAAKPPSWDTIKIGKSRFKVLSAFNGEAVLDKETGLVWEKLAGDTNGDQVVGLIDDALDWSAALAHCYNKSVGGRKGWRVPTIAELASLVDHTVPSPGPTLPAGHPFDSVQTTVYWSATTDVGNSGVARNVDFFTGDVGAFFDKSFDIFVWCVRGGQGIDSF